MKKLKVGFDFDGVIAYNPFRIIRFPVSYFKRNVLGMKKLSFIYPRYRWQQMIWTFLHESSVFPAKGVDLVKELIKEERIEAHLITGRYSFLDGHLHKWLDKHNLKEFFKTINTNRKNEQPHLFKERLIRHRDLDIFIEDNLDIVKHLHGRGKTKIYWIYNLFDRNIEHPYKYPYLEKAMQDIIKKLT